MTGKGGPPSAHNIYEIQTSRPRAQGGPEVVGPGPSSHSQSRICTPSPRQGGAAGWSSARSSRCGKDPGPKVGPKGSISVRAVVLKRICIPPRGRGGAGWFQHPQLALRDESVLHPPPQYVRPVSPPRTTPVPRRPRVANAVPHKQAPVTVGKQQTPNLSIRRVSSPSTQAGYPSSSTSTASWVWVSISRVERWERRLWLRVLAVKVGGRCTGTKGFATRTRSDGAGIPGRGQC